ncbi:MAG TPA: BTAD domain-containing putative transcriptional regulator [Anaerolineales bacterium]|nr:BTAD domain-containing putative transcriptional regulator [Anaerolineales bacterium]
MSETKLTLFGPPRLERDGQQVEISRRKTMAMLAYLAVTGHAHSRDSLAALLWPEFPQSQARGNLRRALSELNREAGEGLLLLDSETVALTGDGIWSDVAGFRACLNSCSTHNHPPQQTCPDCVPLLEESVALYQADFLAGFTLRDAVTFDDWQYFETESLRQSFAAALERLVNWLSSNGDFDAAIPYARRWLSLDPLHEPAQYELIQLYHQAGQSSAAIRQYELYVELLEKEIGTTPTPETTALYEEIKTNRQSAESKASVRHQIISRPVKNLPVQPTPFLGRKQELLEITRLLTENPDCRLVTLVGPGGIGKTRLSVEAAVCAGDAFRDGMAFVSLAAVTDSAFIVSAIAEAIQINLQGEADPKEQLLHHLRPKNYLLILDNFEQFLSALSTEEHPAAESLIVEILQTAPQLKLIVTSRERLRLQEEWVFDVQGMPFPQESLVPESVAQTLEHYPSIQLFLQRAQKAKSDFALTAEDWNAVVRICQLVDGMPLGIELAAPWVRLMSCQEIADEIERSFDLLETSLRNVLERHRSMRAILQQTWGQLTAEEQSALRKLSFFKGGCSRDASESVAGASLHVLSSLVDKALLRRVEGRYEIHELIRQFAFEQLQKSPDVYNEIRNAHYRYYNALLEQQVKWLKGGPQLDTVKRITADIDNIRAAWQQAVKLRDVQAMEQSAESLFLYSEMNGKLVEAESAFQQATTALAASTDHDLDTALRERHESTMGYLLVLQGVLALHTGKTHGLEITRRGMELVRSHMRGNTQQSRYRGAFCLMWLGWASFLPGLYRDAERSLEEALAIFTKIDEPWGIAKTLFMISNVDIAQGQLVKAETALRKSLSICLEHGDSRSRILVNRTLGIVTLWFGDLPLTQQLLEEAVLLSQEFNDLLGLENTLRELGKLRAAQGELELAEQTLLQSIEICFEIGAHWEGELAYCDLGDLYRIQGDYEAAEQALQRGLQAAIATGNRWWHPRCLAELGCIAGARKDYVVAEQLFREALNLWQNLKHEPFYAWGLAQFGHIKTAQDSNNFREASQLYKQGLEIAVKHGQSPIALNIFVGLAKRLLETGERQKALELLHLAVHHPTSYYETKEKARKLLEASGIHPKAVENQQVADWQVIAKKLMEMSANFPENNLQT